MARDCVRFAAEFEPLGKCGRAAVDRPAGGDPQDLALGTLRRRADSGQIRKLPRNQPGIRPERAVQAAREPMCAGGAKGTIPIKDEPRHLANSYLHAFNLLKDRRRLPRLGAETYVHVGFPRSAQVANCANREQAVQTPHRPITKPLRAPRAIAILGTFG
jgi:hypothetical protein